VIENFWDGQSVLSGGKDLENVALVRWDVNEEWSPWNCILLTKSEAAIHVEIEDISKVESGRLL